MVAVRDRMDELEGAVVAVVTFADRGRLEDYRRRLDLPFPVLSDPDRDVYRAFGLGRGRWHQVYGWATLRRYGQLLAGGRRPDRPTDDTLQLGGDFVIDANGRLVFGYWGSGPADRPSVDELVDAVARA